MEALLVLATILFQLATTCQGAADVGIGAGVLSLPIHLLRPLSGTAGGHRFHGVSCNSWRLGVETNNLQGWTTVPEECEDYVGNYMLGHLYRQDSEVVASAAATYAASLNLTGDGKDIWIFDIDETVLSNLPYYAKHGFGTQPYNDTIFQEWVDTGRAPALPESWKLYKKLLSLGLKIVFLTGRSEIRREITEKNLKKAGYHTWRKLILRQSDDVGTAVVYKSSKRKQLEEQGYRILGNMGDQWSDILGANVGQRTFKVPDPLYYIN